MLGLTLILGCIGCREVSPESWGIASFRISLGEPQPGLRDFSFTEEQAQSELGRALLSTPRFVLLDDARRKPHPSAQTFLCRLELVLARESPSEIVSHALKAEVGVVVELWRAEGQPRLTADGIGEVSFDPKGDDEASAAARQGAFMRALGRAIRQAVDEQVLQLESLEKTTSGLIADLDSNDMRRRDFAIRALGERRALEASEALIACLAEEEEPALVLRAAGALGSLGDERAIPVLIDVAERESLPTKAALLSIIGFIGGDMAEGYLFTLSTGHVSEDVRRIAQLQLDTIEKRGQASNLRPKIR